MNTPELPEVPELAEHGLPQDMPPDSLPGHSPAESLLRNTVRADVLAAQAYAVPPAVRCIKLDAMENPHTLPEALQVELAKRLAQTPLNRYPSPQAKAMERALRDAHRDIPRGAHILFGNGSDELIDIVVRTCCMPGDVVMSPVPTFVMYKVFAQWSHARFEGVDLNPDFSLNMPAMLRAIATHRPKVLFLAYPNNPTGVAFREAELVQMIRATPGLVVIDEAYEAFANNTFMARVLEFPNVLVLRTLSKLGLAGVRLGYAVACQSWAEQLDKVRPPYNVNVLTRVAVEFALEHMDVLRDQAHTLKTNREALRTALLGLSSPGREVEVLASQANFLLMRCPNASAVFERLKTQGVLVKNVSQAHPLLHNCLRITVSTQAENDVLVGALRQSL